MRRLADGTLVVLVGPSGAGKSTWALENVAPEATVSSDALRAVVGEGEHDQSASRDAFDLLDRIVAARLRRRLTTVIDSTGLDRPSRDRWRAMAIAAAVPCVAVVLDTPAPVCRRRNAARERPVPARVLAQQVADFAALRPRLDDEGFDEVIVAEPVRVVAPSVATAARAVLQGPEALPSVGPDVVVAPPSRGLRFGLALSSFAVPGGAAQLRDRLGDVAARAEAAGFDSIWVMDHLRQIPQLGRAWDDLPESLATLGYLAAVTRTATIGALVHGVTLRNVPLLGKSLATLDVLAGGRVWCGLGAGWFEAEQKAFGMPFPPDVERLDLLEDALQVLPLLWGPGSPSFEGRRITVPEALSYPRPLRGRIPILVGGQGERRTLRLAAQYADACNLTGDVEAVRHKVAVLHRHCVDVGRDPAVVEVTHLSTVLVAADPSDLDVVVARRRPARGVPRWTALVNPGTVEDHVLRARALQAAGAQHLIVGLDDVWDSPAVERYAEVIAALR
jgi:alkanesulfonate monooxygenase SsuD/methylene tetrahydromethanopterin reductase-like flavin-dependent oxidoreductase (luciferase family)/predicted kinase